MAKIGILISFLIFGASISLAQSGASNLRGSVTDTAGHPIEYATVLMLSAKDSSIVKKSLTDKNAEFKFTGIVPGNYVLLVSYLGFKQKFSGIIAISESANQILPPIALKSDQRALKEVSVTAKKPFVELELDKMIINVQNSIVSDGGTASEILEKVPGVLVDGDGKISLMGKSGVTVLINGRPTHLSSDDLSNRLRTMQSNNIEKIEVITNPSSKYDAAGTGGIINLVMKKNGSFGVNGGVTSALSYGDYYKYNGSTNLNYRTKNINVYGSYSLLQSPTGRQFDVDRQENVQALLSKSYRKSLLNNNSLNAGVDYYPNEKTIIGFFVSGYLENNNSVLDNHTDIRNVNVIDSGSVLKDTKKKSGQNFALNLNLKHTFKRVGEEFSSDFDFTNFDLDAADDIKTDFFYQNANDSKRPLLLTSQLPSKLKILSFKSDYSLPINDRYKTEMGIKSSYVFADNNALFNVYNQGEWEVDKGKTNHFKYGEYINAAYATATGKFKKWSVQIGIRGEQTISIGNSLTLKKEIKKNYVNLFPTMFVSRSVGEEQTLTFSYSRRIGRPNYKELNPFTYFIDNYTYYYGNSNLTPEYSHSFNINYNYKSFLVASFNYTRTTDIFTYIYSLETQPDSSKIWASSMGNLNASDNYSLNLNSPLKIASWWDCNNNVLVFYNKYNTDYTGGYLKNSRVILSLSTRHSFTLPKSFKAEISGSYKTPSLDGFHVVKPQSSVNFGVQKTFLQNKARVSFNVNDFFNKMQWSSNMYLNDIHVQYYNKWETRIYRVSFSYQFGRDTIKATRQRNKGAEESKRVQ